MLTKEEVKKIKEKLENSKKEFEARIKELETIPELGTDVDHFEEEADEAEEFSTNIGIEQVYKERLKNIKAALNKINDSKKKKYGLCERCGKEISIKLLNINPESRFCRGCKTK
jgi:DnaK suppressor protein